MFKYCLWLLIFSACCSADIFKWTDSNGRVHFSDTADKQQQVETITIKTNSYQHLSYGTAASNTSRKLKLFSAEWCGFCKKAKRYFIAEGIPFDELDIDKNPKAKREYTALGGQSVPIILMGKKRMNGFSIEGFKRFYNKS
ncbi:MAG: glutaredoxin [Pseudohongiellaceae bacterium]|jgi:glutaredoxin